MVLSIFLLLAMAFIMPSTQVCAKSESDSLVLQRVLEYKKNVYNAETELHTNVYLRYYFKTEKRNFMLMAIPSMYAISRGRREYAGESYSTLTMKNGAVTKAVRQLNTGTIPHHRNVMETMMK